MYAIYGLLGRELWQNFDFIAARSTATARRIHCFGVPREDILVCGNLKQALLVPERCHLQAAEKRQQLGVRPVIVAGSTHAGEVEVLLQAFHNLLNIHPDALLAG